MTRLEIAEARHDIQTRSRTKIFFCSPRVCTDSVSFKQEQRRRRRTADHSPQSSAKIKRNGTV